MLISTGVVFASPEERGNSFNWCHFISKIIVRMNFRRTGVYFSCVLIQLSCQSRFRRVASQVLHYSANMLRIVVCPNEKLGKKWELPGYIGWRLKRNKRRYCFRWPVSILFFLSFPIHHRKHHSEGDDIILCNNKIMISV